MKHLEQTGREHHTPLHEILSENPTIRKYLEIVQDLIVLCLCTALFVAMLIKLIHLGQSLLGGTDFSAVVADILFILVLIELYRLLNIYLEQHRISVSTVVEVGIVSTLREVILTGALQIDGRQMLVLCTSVLTLTSVPRYAGIRFPKPRRDRFVRPIQTITTSG